MRAVLVVTCFLVLAAGQINRLIGSSGASGVSRVMGLILASVATSKTLAGIKCILDCESVRMQAGATPRSALTFSPMPGDLLKGLQGL